MYRQIKSIFKCLKKSAKWSYVKIICHFRSVGCRMMYQLRKRLNCCKKKKKKRRQNIVAPSNQRAFVSHTRAWKQAGDSELAGGYAFGTQSGPQFLYYTLGYGPLRLVQGWSTSISLFQLKGDQGGYVASLKNCDLEVDALMLLQEPQGRRLSLEGFSEPTQRAKGSDTKCGKWKEHGGIT